MKVFEWNKGWQLWDLVLFLKENGALNSRLIYRGHRLETWKLIPGLYRREVNIPGNVSLEERYMFAENDMIDYFFSRGHLLLPQFERSDLLDRIIAQHYGVPTQLLDWTLDPLIGLYFAVEEWEGAGDAALFYIKPKRTNRAEKISLPHKGKISRIIPPVIDERVRAQKSVFTLQNFGAAENFTPLDDRALLENEVSDFGKVVIPSSRKGQIFGQLMEIGVDRAQLFPGLQGIGERIASQAHLKRYGGSRIY